MFNPAIVLGAILVEDGGLRGKSKDWSALLGFYVLGGLAGTAVGYFTFHENGDEDMFYTYTSEF